MKKPKKVTKNQVKLRKKVSSCSKVKPWKRFLPNGLRSAFNLSQTEAEFRAKLKSKLEEAKLFSANDLYITSTFVPSGPAYPESIIWNSRVFVQKTDTSEFRELKAVTVHNCEKNLDYLLDEILKTHWDDKKSLKTKVKAMLDESKNETKEKPQ